MITNFCTNELMVYNHHPEELNIQFSLNLMCTPINDLGLYMCEFGLIVRLPNIFLTHNVQYLPFPILLLYANKSKQRPGGCWSRGYLFKLKLNSNLVCSWLNSLLPKRCDSKHMTYAKYRNVLSNETYSCQRSFRCIRIRLTDDIYRDLKSEVRYLPRGISKISPGYISISGPFNFLSQYWPYHFVGLWASLFIDHPITNDQSANHVTICVSHMSLMCVQ